MPGFDISLAFFGTAIILGIAPGPDNIFVLTQSALYGASAGIFTTLGLVCGICVHTLAVALGVAIIFNTSPLAFILLKCIGAGYLCWLAWLSFRAGTLSTRKVAFPGYMALFRRGIIMNVTNPKVSLFFLAFLPQFCTPEAGPMGLQIIFFGILFMLATIIVFFTVAFMGGKITKLFNKSPLIQIVLHKITGCIFIGLALFLIFTENS